MAKICLSPSEQSYNLYSYGGTNEQDQCRRIADYARQALEKNGHTVMVSARDQRYETKAVESNSWGADLHIPIHTNAGGGRGVEVLAWSGSTANPFVKSVYDELNAINPNPGRGIKVGDHLLEINSTKAIAIYPECEFHDNATYARWIVDNVKPIGEAIARGVCKAYGQTYQPIDDPEPVLPPSPPNAEVNLIYEAHCQDVGWAGQMRDGQTAGTIGRGLRLEAARVDTAQLGVPGRLVLAGGAHLAGIGTWYYGELDPDTIIGTVGQSRQIEMLGFKTIENTTGRKPYFRVHQAEYGWGGWQEVTAEMAYLGSTSQSRQLEAFEIKLI